jgi:CubicO group peptidase (beta-lactamase class C family)
MRVKFLSFIFLLSLGFHSCKDTGNSIKSYFGFSISKQKIDAHLKARMDDLNIPGMSIAFINDGKVVHYRTFGYANIQDSLPVTEKTIFEAASLSKSVFAYFVMKCVEDGMLGLDIPLHTYLPNKDILHDERYKKITARMVLSHRTGFPNWRSDLPDNKLTIAFEPGTAFLYSGEGYQYLAEVLKKLGDGTWEGLEERFQKRIAKPLGLEHTVFIQNEYITANKAEPYDEGGRWISPDRDKERSLRVQFIAPASIHTESLDFSKWLIALMNREGLDQDSFNELFKVHAYANEFGGIKFDYTLGFYKPQAPFTNIFTHGGNNYGFTSWFAIDPDKKWGFILFTNSEYGEQLGGELMLDLLLGPDPTSPLIILGLIFLSLIAMLLVSVKFIVRTMQR